MCTKKHIKKVDKFLYELKNSVINKIYYISNKSQNNHYLCL